MPDPPPLGAGDPTQIGTSRLVGVLGRGGQGSVYLGLAPDGRKVAVKVLHDRMVMDSKARMRFIREAEIAQRVAAFCTAQVLDVGFQANVPYVVSEYIAGPSLHHLVTEDGPRTGSSLDRLAVTTLTALAAIHRAGIIHRDFKPGNVIMGPEGPVVIDFGIARFAGHHATTGQGIVGTPAYIAPEQIANQPAGTRSDVFAWAATMVFAATGRVAFGKGGAALPAIIHAVLHEEPDLSAVPERLRPLLAAALAKRPGARPGVHDLLAVLTDDDRTREEPEADAGAPAASSTASVSTLFLPAAGASTGQTAGTASSPPTEVIPPFGQRVAAVFNGRSGAVTALAVDDSRGRPVVVSADVDRTLWAWDLVTGQPVGEPMHGHADRITKVLITCVDGAPTVVSSDRNGRVKTWDMASGACVREWDEVGDIVTVSRWEGRAVLIRGGGTVVEFFDLSDGALIRRPLTLPFYRYDPGATPVISQLAVAEWDGRQVIVAGCRADTILRRAVWVFDPASGDLAPAPRRMVGGSIELMGVIERVGQPLVVTYGRAPVLGRRMIRTWSLATGEQAVKIDQAATFRRGTDSLAVAQLDGGPALLATARDATLRVWDLTTGRRIGEPIRCRIGRVVALAVTRVAGFPVAVAGGADGSVHAWSLAS
ncbi:WD40 repeat domain-containing serine/threonine protein kinase [Phytoactinopolyspora halotolerans]|uniref:Protein kinase n=1 Tax=Phytoactinopolyspora halotolerans TaxID=1981512 RepID=A0A6L9SE06_9ACTN|nr:WD40 repeat domain-containing serine/threonine protein kinase [Phytoactinopolyspora halotolerans]NEE02768.1 protein kinase [Phytoactinopolyspora halotolerans]